MVKELIGNATGGSWRENTQEIGLRISDMDEELSLAQTVIDTMDFGSWETPKERDEWFMQMKTSMKVSGMREKETGMEF